MIVLFLFHHPQIPLLFLQTDPNSFLAVCWKLEETRSRDRCPLFIERKVWQLEVIPAQETAQGIPAVFTMESFLYSFEDLVRGKYPCGLNREQFTKDSGHNWRC
ncbi:hypothetical protein AV530_004975 [Patagioenas fasciata monilis]|uniref:Uncharacterized protein n=1 Tax=Patagioenas fasciata monilis TaxID=372326 RepID=A0A1V4K3Q0_PATFA|nr:hypothetical protein AV530_004975 [Patagioenas fasciata monilis]